MHRPQRPCARLPTKPQAIINQLPPEYQSLAALHSPAPDIKQVTVGGVEVDNEDIRQFHKDMNTLFQQVYPNLKTRAFDREHRMPKEVQHYLKPELKALREQKAQGGVRDPEAQVSLNITKGQLAVELGHGTKPNKGATGTLIITDVNGVSVGVHKVSEEHVPKITRMKNIFKAIFGGQLSYLSQKRLAQPLSERASFLLSSALGFDVAPASKEATIGKRHGVFQIYLSREKGQGPLDDVKQAQVAIQNHKTKQSKMVDSNQYEEAKGVIDQIDGKKEFSETEQTIFQKFALFDYLIGNLDRHEENWFVTMKQNEQGEPEITRIKAIDNANAFPKKVPRKNSRGSRNQYKWKIFNIAKKPFTQETLDFVKNNLESEKIDAFIRELHKDMKGFLDKDMEALLRQRANMIIDLVKEGKTPAELANTPLPPSPKKTAKGKK